MTEEKWGDDLVKPEYEFDLTKLTNDEIVEFRQEGNYLIGRTRNGTTFSRRIPNNKILNKIDGKYVLEDMKV